MNTIWRMMRALGTGDAVLIHNKKPFHWVKQKLSKPAEQVTWEDFNEFFKQAFKVNKNQNPVIYCVKNGPFHKYIKKLTRKQ